MDKTKIGALLALIAIGGVLFLSKAQDPPAPSEDDHDESSHAAQTTPPPPADASLVGGVTKLKIEDLKVGTGPVAKDGDQLSMNYKGQLLNGEVFDQSYGRGPFDFQLGGGQVIRGWDEGIKGMKVGGKRRLTIPADMGYGAAGSPPKIPGGATLKFDVELLSVNGKK